MRTRRTFDLQFKKEAVELSRSPNVTQKRVCEELGISPNLLSRWRRELRDDGGDSSSPREAELLRKVDSLESQLASRDAEVRFLKKAAAYFAQASESGAR